jgi:hypothetical protein
MNNIRISPTDDDDDDDDDENKDWRGRRRWW